MAKYSPTANKKRYLAITCEIMYREICHCVANSSAVIDLFFMEKALHDAGADKMSATLQASIDRVDFSKYDAILLVYGLCNNGVKNLKAPIPIVIPRAHDCITLLMGSKERYDEYFNANPGTFFHTSGWLERDVSDTDSNTSITSQLGMGRTYQQYVEEYGEENAEYIMSILGNWEENYKKLAFVNNGIGDTETDLALSKKHAEDKGWEYEIVAGDISLLQSMVDGDWQANRFLVVPPNNIILPSNDESIVTCQPD